MVEKKIISYKRFNPNFHHLKVSLRNDDYRFIYLYGGSSSAKSFSASQAFLLECISFGYNTMVFRKVGSAINDSIYKTFKEAIKSLRLEAFFQCQERLIKCFNGSYITFKGLDDSEKIKGLESYQYVFCEELSEFEEGDLKQIRKRLRGRKGQKIVCLFNPISEDHWIKKKIFDHETFIEVENHLFGILKDNINGNVLGKEYSEVKKKWTNSERIVFNPRTNEYETHKPDTVVILSTYLNNFWVVGSPDGSYGFYDNQTIADFEKDKNNDYAYYLVYALGEWGTIKTGGEFFHAFEPSKHKGNYKYNPCLPIHISIDNNVLPYISISIWQIEQKDKSSLRQIHEIPAEDPFNTVTKAAELTVDYLEKIGHTDMIYLYGDASSKSRNTIDEEKRSFFDKYKEVLEDKYRVEERIDKSNPSVSMSGEFINAIYSGSLKNTEIRIDESCKVSISDYIKVKKDANGGMLKKRITDKITRQSYEEHGHFSDTKRYFVTQVMKEEYIKYSLVRKRNKINSNNMKYYNPDKVNLSNSKVVIEINPDINGKYIFVCAKIKEGRAYICHAIMSETLINADAISKFIPTESNIQVECSSSYLSYLQDLRSYFDDVRGRPDFSNKKRRIEAHIASIKSSFYFPSNYDIDDGFRAFVENMLDYKDKENIEALNSLASISERLLRLKD